MADTVNKKAILNVLYTDIGRGHPFYLDGIVERLKSEYSQSIQLNVFSVFSISKSLSFVLWKTIRHLYKIGSQGGGIGAIYSRLRKQSDSHKYGFIEKMLSSNIRSYLRKNNFPTLVAHPILVPMISDLVPTYYQHGEMTVPDAAVVKGAEKIFVPLSLSKSNFIEKGLCENNLLVSGLCIEKELVEQAYSVFEKRLIRLKNKDNLVGGFFSSGAEPKGHVDKIVLALTSLYKSDQRAVVFCMANGALEKSIKDNLRVVHFESFDNDGDIDKALGEANILSVIFSNRESLDKYTSLFFKYFDYIVAPAHERINWAVGLGLPMFVLHPMIGSFSPLNRDFLLENRVAFDIKTNEQANNFATILRQMKDIGNLIEMAGNGFGRHEIDGFNVIADFLTQNI